MKKTVFPSSNKLATEPVEGAEENPVGEFKSCGEAKGVQESGVSDVIWSEASLRVLHQAPLRQAQGYFLLMSPL